MTDLAKDSVVNVLRQEAIKTWCLNGIEEIALKGIGDIIKKYVTKFFPLSEESFVQDVNVATKLGLETEGLTNVLENSDWVLRSVVLGHYKVERICGARFWNSRTLDQLGKRVQSIVEASKILEGSQRVAVAFDNSNEQNVVITFKYLEETKV